MIQFNKPPLGERSTDYVKQAVENGKMCGDGVFTKQCNEWLEKRFHAEATLLTTSCTHALEMSAILAGIDPGDEVIMPSYTFCSTANAFVMRGAKIKFVDIRPDTMNLDENLIEAAITERTKAIVPVHYAGISCEMDTIQAIAEAYNLLVIEDAAQGVMSTYKKKALGTIGDFGCYSFHETKNYSMGEGGAILIKDLRNVHRAEIIREKGTNRSNFLRGQVDKYSWVDYGSSYLPSDLLAAFLYAQLEEADKINDNRLQSWQHYQREFKPLEAAGKIVLPTVPDNCVHNAHMFYLKVKDLEERTKLIQYMKENGIVCTFHYIPLHSSEAGMKFGEFVGEDIYTTLESERLLRLPLYYGLSDEKIDFIVEKLKAFYV